MNIYLIDYIGVHCGMHYYLEAFKKHVDSPENRIIILSNYSDDHIPFFKHQYKGNVIQKSWALLVNYYKLLRFIKAHPNDLFVYLTYGNVIDILFLYIVSCAKNHMIDIHEAIAQYIDDKIFVKKQLGAIYGKRICSVITHSQRTNDFLDEWGYTRKRLFVPHFRYCFAKSFNIHNVQEDVIKSLRHDKINLLFFGNITYAKGIDILLSAINKLDEQSVGMLNVIIAGKDADGSYSIVDLKYPDRIQFVLRHINDDELVYLYQNIDFVCMPYRKTSQSGILEMAFYFKKPIIATKIPYFENMLRNFRSFGILADGATPESYTEAVVAAINIDRNDFFLDADYAIYENREEMRIFRNEFLQEVKTTTINDDDC